MLVALNAELIVSLKPYLIAQRGRCEFCFKVPQTFKYNLSTVTLSRTRCQCTEIVECKTCFVVKVTKQFWIYFSEESCMFIFWLTRAIFTIIEITLANFYLSSLFLLKKIDFFLTLSQSPT